MQAPSFAEVEAARARIAEFIAPTPLLRLPGAGPSIWLKLENLQPIGSFKLRGAANALALADPQELARGVVTASAGNMAQGVGWVARRLGIRFTAVVPDHAPRTKREAIEALGGRIVAVPFEEWWRTLERRAHPEAEGFFLHPVADPAVIAGNGTVGLEILEQLAAAQAHDEAPVAPPAAVLVPFGGGGLSCGIALALRGRGCESPVHAVEVETAAPFAAALRAGHPIPIERQQSFVDGIGAGGLLEPMWPLARRLLAGSRVVGLDAIRGALRILIERAHVVAEGAGAAPIAAALDSPFEGEVVCVVSGGNIDLPVLMQELGA